MDTRHLNLMKAVGGRSLMVMPLIARDIAIGTISYGYADSGRRYSEEFRAG